MPSSSRSDVRDAIDEGVEATLVLDGNQMEAIHWMLHEAGFERVDEAPGLTYWVKELAGLGRYRCADLVYIAASEIESELFDESFTVFTQYDERLMTFWTAWAERFTTASTLDRGK